MTYRLRLDPTVHADYRSLPHDARRDLAMCLIDALADPIAASTPYGIDDRVFRTIARGHTTGVILIGEDTITLVQLTHLG